MQAALKDVFGSMFEAILNDKTATSNATLLSVFSDESRIIVTLLFASISWLTVFSTSFYLPLSLLTFNLPTTPNKILYDETLRRMRYGI